MYIKNFKDISILDSPGFNDPDKSRSDTQTFIQMFNVLTDPKEDMLWGGVATILQCVMVPQSGRINGSAIELMSKMLQIFTLSYPDQTSKGPQALVLFTDFSIHETDNDSGDISYDEEETKEEDF